MNNTQNDNNNYAGEIAVIGMAGRFPGASDLAEYWSNLRNCVESISFFTAAELEEAGIDPEVLSDPNYIRAKGYIDNSEYFDAGFFDYTPREVEIADPQIRLLLECSREAIERAGYSPEDYQGKIGVYVGAEPNYNWVNRVKDLNKSRGTEQQFNEFLFTRDYVATTISYKLNLQGPSVTLLTACSTSLVAIHEACKSLLYGECDVAIAGAASISSPSKTGYLYVKDSLVSSDGHCRAFDEKADGTLWSDGVGIVVLKPLVNAIRDRDSILAVIKGSAVNNDGGKITYTASSKKGQVEVITAALRKANVDPETITFIETHGTGTRIGDPYEIQALKEVFRSTRKGFCAIGSVKSNIGHLGATAGAAGFIKTVLSLYNREIVPTLHVENPNPRINFSESPFFVNTKLIPWKSDTSPRRAGVTSLGMGGTNAHIILEEAPEYSYPKQTFPCETIVLSAKTENALRKTIENLIQFLNLNPGIHLHDVCYTLNTGRTEFNYRRFVVCKDIPDAILKLAGSASFPSGIATSKKEQVVFMFPGSGTQHINMCLDLYTAEPYFKENIDYCSAILEPYLDISIKDIIYPDKDAEDQAAVILRQISIAQPAIFIISIALAKQWMRWGISPKVLLGHSFGEITAACIAGVMSLEDALLIIAKRGRLMQQTAVGAMLSIPLAEERLTPMLEEGVYLAAVNSPSDCVVSGSPEKMEIMRTKLLADGIQAHYLHIDVASHSQAMDPTLDEFKASFENIKLTAPKIRIMSSVTGKWLTDDEATSATHWVNNLRLPVKFSMAIQRVLEETTCHLLETGPGVTLLALANSHRDPVKSRIKVSSSPHAKDRISSYEHVLTSAGKLWLAGVTMKWRNYYEGKEGQRIALPTYPYEKQKYMIDIKESVKTEKTNSSITPEKMIVHEETLVTPLSNERTAIEDKLTEIFKHFLGHDKIGLHDNFFELGGTSLLATYLIAHIEKTISYSIGLTDVFANPSIAQLAYIIETKSRQGHAGDEHNQIRKRILGAFPQDRKNIVTQYLIRQSGEVLRDNDPIPIQFDRMRVLVDDIGIQITEKEFQQLQSIDELTDFIIRKFETNVARGALDIGGLAPLAVVDYVQLEEDKIDDMSEEEIQKLLDRF